MDEFEHRLTELDRLLAELGRLLAAHGEERWLAWIVRSRHELASYEQAAFDHVLRAFGGMTSIEDLVLTGINGHRIDPREEPAVNDQLSRLRAAVLEQTTLIRHLLGRPSTPPATGAGRPGPGGELPPREHVRRPAAGPR